jgi:hypothetical protein
MIAPIVADNIAAKSTAPAAMSLMVLIAGLYSVVMRLQTFSIAEFTISMQMTSPMQHSTNIHSNAVIPKAKLSEIIMTAITPCIRPFFSVLKKERMPAEAYLTLSKKLGIQSPKIISFVISFLTGFHIDLMQW